MKTKREIEAAFRALACAVSAMSHPEAAEVWEPEELEERLETYQCIATALAWVLERRECPIFPDFNSNMARLVSLADQYEAAATEEGPDE